jgi:hypothetical protein
MIGESKMAAITRNRMYNHVYLSLYTTHKITTMFQMLGPHFRLQEIRWDICAIPGVRASRKCEVSGTDQKRLYTFFFISAQRDSEEITRSIDVFVVDQHD